MEIKVQIQYKEPGERGFIGEVTDAQIKIWKAENKYGIYATPLKKSGHIGYFRKPDLDDLNCAYAKMDTAKSFDKWKELAEVTWLGGSDEILNNDRLFVAIVPSLQDSATGEECELVNL